MSYDLKVLVVQSKDVYHIDFKSSIKLMNEIEDEYYRYKYIWPYVTNTTGIWYSLVQEYEGLYDAYDICESDFKIDKNDIDMPYWVEDEEVRYDLTPLIIKNEFRNDFEKIISSLIKTSPIKTVMLLSSYQGQDKEIICGVLSLKEYLSLLNRRKILFNVCYIVTD